MPRINGGRPGAAEDDPVLGPPELQGEEQRLDEGCPQKAPPKKVRVEWDPRGVRCKTGSE